MKKAVSDNFNIKGFLWSQVLIVLSLLVVICFSFFVFYNALKTSRIKDGKATVESVGNNLEKFLLEKCSVLDAAAGTVNYLQKNNTGSEKIVSYLEYLSRSQKIDFYGLVNNVIVDNTGQKKQQDYDVKGSLWYTEAFNANGKTIISSPYFDLSQQAYVVSISKMLDDRKSVVSMDLKLDVLQEYGLNLVKNDTDVIVILDHEGYVIAHTDINEQGLNYLHQEDSEESRSIKRIFYNPQKEIFTEEASYKGTDSLLFSRKILHEWYVLVFSNKNAIFVRTLKQLLPIIAGFMVIVGFMIFLCTTSFAARLKLSRYAQMLSKYKTDLEHQVVDQWNQLDRKTHDLVDMQETVIEGMATIIEYRDVNTGMHVQATKKYVLMIAKYLLEHDLHKDEVDEKFLSMIGNAAAMHDIGKIAINDRILNKPGKLDDSEYEIIKTHTLIGAGLVRQVFGKTIPEEMLRMCIDVVQYHHEKWNGKGYPIGLEGEDIPLSARIMAIADVFDAIASKRVYKDAVPVDEVFEIIKKDAGVHFDPELAEIFCSMKEEVKDYIAQAVKDRPVQTL